MMVIEYDFHLNPLLSDPPHLPEYLALQCEHSTRKHTEEVDDFTHIFWDCPKMQDFSWDFTFWV